MIREMNNDKVNRGYELFDYAVDKISEYSGISFDYLDNKYLTIENNAGAMDTFDTDFEIPYAYLIMSSKGDTFRGCINLDNDIITITIGDSDLLDDVNNIVIYIDSDDVELSKTRIDRGVEVFLGTIKNKKAYKGVFIVKDKELNMLREDWAFINKSSLNSILKSSKELNDLMSNIDRKELERIVVYTERNGNVHFCVIKKDLTATDTILSDKCETFETEDEYIEYNES